MHGDLSPGTPTGGPEAGLDRLDAMGIQVWVPRLPVPHGPGDGAADVIEVPAVGAPPCPAPGLYGDWETLEREASVCRRCALHETRTQVVFGVGHRAARWMFIGEAPGEQEDLQGEPFVGRAGQLLTEMIKAVGLSREEVYIANVLKCRPPRNRDPLPEEAAACESYLLSQVALVKPALIIAVGRIAAQHLLKTSTPIGKLRGVVHDYRSIPLVVTYHPAYLLRSQTEKRRAWEDLKLARKTVAARA